MTKIYLVYSLIFMFLLVNRFGFAQVESDIVVNNIPKTLNEKAILNCLPKLKGFLNSDELTSLDNLKTKVERVYGFKRPMIEYRELIYKDSSEQKWKVEFYLMPDSMWSKEKYKLKFFKEKSPGNFLESSPPFTMKEEVLNKEAVLRYAQYESIQSDERWERFAIPGSPKGSYKSKDFKLFELTVVVSPPKGMLTCTMAGGFPVCSCSK